MEPSPLPNESCGQISIGAPSVVLLDAPFLQARGASIFHLLRAAWLTCARSLQTSPLGRAVVSITKPASLSRSCVLGCVTALSPQGWWQSFLPGSVTGLAAPLLRQEF